MLKAFLLIVVGLAGDPEHGKTFQKWGANLSEASVRLGIPAERLVYLVDKPADDLKNVTESSLTAVMGRMACYTGRLVEWEQALNSQQRLMPERLAWDMELPVPPVAMPGQTPLL